MAPPASELSRRRSVIGQWALVLVGLAVLIIVLVHIFSPDVPSMDALGLAPGVEVAGDTSGPSTVDTENIKQTFRYAVLRDTRRESLPQLMRREVAFLLAHGWHGGRATVGYTRANGDEVYPAVPLGRHGAIVSLDRGSDIHASLQGLLPREDADAYRELPLDCCATDPAVRNAIQRDQPLITVTMYRG